MAHSLSDTDPLKPYLLQVINSLKFTLGEPLEINKGVGDLPLCLCRRTEKAARLR